MGLFYDHIKRPRSIYHAWQHVRVSARKSSNEKTQDYLAEIEENLPSEIQSICSYLSDRTYPFSAAHGILKDKRNREREGKSPRPVVVAMLRDRIVQRTILESLQPSVKELRYAHLGRIEHANKPDFSIGGVKGGGVENGIKQIISAISNGYTYFYKSDIIAFFTCISHDDVCSFILQQTKDDEIVSIFRKAVTVEIDNKDELTKYLDLFPHDGVGFAQGSSLSAFAGNILLLDFDQQMNSGSTKMFRYIDDIIMGASPF